MPVFRTRVCCRDCNALLRDITRPVPSTLGKVDAIERAMHEALDTIMREHRNCRDIYTTCERIERELETMDFGKALNELRAGRRVTRVGWHRKGMSVAMMVEDAGVMLPYLYLRLPDTRHIPWTISQADVLADDWEVLV